MFISKKEGESPRVTLSLADYGRHLQARACGIEVFAQDVEVVLDGYPELADPSEWRVYDAVDLGDPRAVLQALVATLNSRRRCDGYVKEAATAGGYLVVPSKTFAGALDVQWLDSGCYAYESEYHGVWEDGYSRFDAVSCRRAHVGRYRSCGDTDIVWMWVSGGSSSEDQLWIFGDLSPRLAKILGEKSPKSTSFPMPYDAELQARVDVVLGFHRVVKARARELKAIGWWSEDVTAVEFRHKDAGRDGEVLETWEVPTL